MTGYKNVLWGLCSLLEDYIICTLKPLNPFFLTKNDGVLTINTTHQVPLCLGGVLEVGGVKGL